MTTLTISIPSYNSADYLHRCIDSMLPLPDDLEVIVVNDGSTDDTSAIAHRYAEQHPQIRVVDKENGGHGSGVNTGMDLATGRYYKVVDSDDWVDRSALEAVLNVLRAQGDDPIDLLITNYVYEKEGRERKHVMRYGNALPIGKDFVWRDVKRFRPSQTLLMHSLAYRTEVLRNSGVRLPEHTFYVDNIFAFVPLKSVRTMHYIDVDLYRYHIGREDQSVNETVMLRRIDQQLRVNRLMFDALPQPGDVEPNLHRYMIHYLNLVTAVSSILLIRSGTPEHIEMKEQLWQDLKQKSPDAYARMRRSPAGAAVNLPGKLGRRAAVGAYHVAQRVVGFN